MRKRVKPEGSFQFVFIDLRRWYILTWIILTFAITYAGVRVSWGDLRTAGNNDIGGILFIAMIVSLLAGVITFTLYERKRRNIKERWGNDYPRCMRLPLSRERTDRRQDLIDDISGYISQERDPHIMRSINYYYIYLNEK